MWGFIAILIASLIFWYSFQKLKEEKSSVKDELLSLQSKPEVAKSDVTKLLLSSQNTGTFQAFFYPLQGQKTGVVTLCNPTGSENPGEPECSTGQYNLCKCIGSDCSRCRHSGYVNLINISNVIRLEMLASPDASRQHAAGAQLVVRTTGMRTPVTAPGSNVVPQQTQLIYEETIPLPNIPFQKWTHVAIAREGRRFDVYYNGEIVLSKRTQYVMDTKAAYGPITAGDPNLLGKIVFVESFPQKLSQTEIMANYKAKSDTTGKPLFSTSANLSDYIPNCEGGDCAKGPKMRPTSPLLDWETQYA